jgi:hypothetical protein
VPSPLLEPYDDMPPIERVADELLLYWAHAAG